MLCRQQRLKRLPQRSYIRTDFICIQERFSFILTTSALPDSSGLPRKWQSMALSKPVISQTTAHMRPENRFISSIAPNPANHRFPAMKVRLPALAVPLAPVARPASVTHDDRSQLEHTASCATRCPISKESATKSAAGHRLHAIRTQVAFKEPSAIQLTLYRKRKIQKTSEAPLQLLRLITSCRTLPTG